jgi:hypothetical protein
MYHSASPQSLLNVTTLQYGHWYSVSDLSALYTTLCGVSLSTGTSKFAALTALLSLPVSSPYTIADGTLARPTDLRFSSSTSVSPPRLSSIFICRDLVDWSAIFTDLTNSLTSPPLLDYFSDPSVDLYYQALSAFSTNLSTGAGAFNYSFFETYFGLSWF